MTPVRSSASLTVARPASNPVSSKVSLIAATRRPRALRWLGLAPIRNLSFWSVTDSPSFITGRKPSADSQRPPGNTYLLGINAWPSWRWPIRIRGAGASKRTRISVAASRGLIVAFFFAACFKAKTMHTESPLQSHYRPFYDGHERQCQAECERQPEGRMDEVGRLTD